MTSARHIPLTPRSLTLATCVGLIIFQLSILNEPYSPVSWTNFSNVDIPALQHHTNKSLGVAAKIYVLSLPSRTDRRDQMEKLREALGLRWAYIDAIDTKNDLVDKILDSVRAARATHVADTFTWPNDLPASTERIDMWGPGFLTLPGITHGNETGQPMLCATQNNTVPSYDPKVKLPQYLFLTPSRIACWHSHLSVIESIANDPELKDDDVTIVLEDDVDMERDIHERLDYLWPFLPKDWDMVYLGHCWSNESLLPALNANDNTTNIFNIYIHPSKSPSCTHAYALSRSGARRLLLHLRYAPFAYSRAVDLAISWLIQSGRLSSYSVVPSVTIQRKVGNSDIMPGKGSKWKDTLINGIFSDSQKSS